MSAWNVPTETINEANSIADRGVIWPERERAVIYFSSGSVEELRTVRIFLTWDRSLFFIEECLGTGSSQ